MKITADYTEIKPTVTVVGTGPLDDDGLPEVTSGDIRAAELREAEGYRQGFLRIQMFPKGIPEPGFETNYVTASYQTSRACVMEALEYFKPAVLAFLDQEESK
jgi:hypothetical protein